jgi:DNA polymerase-3 subunit alpha
MLNYHTHTQYSFLDGYGTPEAFVIEAKRLGQKALGVSEHGNMLSATRFQKACVKHGIKPVFGCEMYIVDDATIKTKLDRRFHIVLMAKNIDGFRDMQKITSYANVKGFYHRPRIDFNVLNSIDLKNVIITTACPISFILNENIDQHTDRLLSSGADIFVEIQPHNHRIHHDFHDAAWKYAKKYNLDLVAGIDAHSPSKDDVVAQDVFMCLQTGSVMSNPDRIKLPSDTYRLMDGDEFISLFRCDNIPPDEVAAAVDNSDWIADECNVKLESKKIILPSPPKIIAKYHDKTDAEVLWELCIQGFKKKLGIDIEVAEDEGLELYFTGDPDGKEKYELYISRLNEEFDLLEQKNFCTYFLIVCDLLEFCRENDIPVGPGRGSVAGSLVSFLLNITFLDPIEHDLIFARFLNEQRNDFPDIDIDISKLRRPEVIEYITKTYGIKQTGFITTFSKMKAKLAIRDVSRAFNIPLAEVDPVAKACYSPEDNDEEALNEGLDSAYGRIFQKKYPEVVKLIRKIRGSIKNVGVHASGIIVHNSDLMTGEQCTILRDKTPANRRICGLEMDDCEFWGLMKLDLLGLATLDIIHHCSKKTGIAWEDIPLNEDSVFETISNGKTLGGFQIEARASTEIVRKIRPKDFDEVSACLALVRPGPMHSGMTDQFIDRKNGIEWDAPHKLYAEITNDTFGVLVYQEQVMKCFVMLAGMTYQESDEIRKIIGKKRDETAFEPYWKKFRDGCIKQQTFTEDEAKEFWIALLKWASYGFNKSHSASYALNTYWCIWYKVNHPETFYEGALSYASWDEKKPDPAKSRVTMLEEVICSGFKVSTPKFTLSKGHLWHYDKPSNTFYMPFDCIQGIQSKAEEISRRKRKVKIISIFDDDEMQNIQAENKVDEWLSEMLCHNNDYIPNLIIQNKFLPFRIPYQQNVKVKDTRNEPERIYKNSTQTHSVRRRHR